MSMRALEDELRVWQHDGAVPRIWWRDDDAVTLTPALEKLQELAERADTQVLLAIIPAHADARLATYVKASSHLTACVHGWAHVNHATYPDKKCELGNHRPLQDVLADVERGCARVRALFEGEFAPVLVPPWNRMRLDLVPHLAEVGIMAFSTFTHKLQEPRIQANTHVDIMSWKGVGGARGKSLDEVAGDLTTAFGVSRKNGGYPIGLLSHHLVHDETAWEVLSELVSLEQLDWCGFPIPTRPVA
ncbi:MAG: polysaccharide deacetylase [Anderseniella sp.]